MLNELVEKIEVFNAEKVNGVWEPVSYTHLDVYKRQETYLPRLTS